MRSLADTKYNTRFRDRGFRFIDITHGVTSWSKTLTYMYAFGNDSWRSARLFP